MPSDQPRQPKDMKGLLKFCFEATKDEDAPDISDPEKILNDMDPERKKWLEFNLLVVLKSAEKMLCQTETFHLEKFTR